MALRLVEWFAGIGGCALALQDRPGFEVVAAVDIDRGALDVYSANFPYPTWVREICSLPAYQVASWQADLWWMSPPCQPYTARGRQRDDQDPRAASLLVLLEWIDRFRPAWLALENVPPFGQSRMWQRLRSRLEKIGYHWASIEVCPTQLGIPNRRRRFYMLASLQGPVEWQPLPYQPHRLGEYLMPPDAEDLWVDRALLARYGHAIHVIDDAWAADSIVSCFTAAYGRSPVRSGSCLRTLHGVRRFSPREVARLMGFPDSFRFPESCSRRRQWNLLGNSLSIPVVRWLLEHVRP
ncbi:MAG: DNA methyltransferase [Pirellulaceae bacterium]|nr:MAG: DNA methyltransferase [Pirellulaceae bacterium]